MGDMAEMYDDLIWDDERYQKTELAVVEYKSIKCLTDGAIRFRIIEGGHDFEMWMPKKMCWEHNRKKKTFETPLKFYEDKMMEALKDDR